ncbi:hypothetical protein BLA29_008193 [Euroglyphus maynei]|uniref:Uncharacterized protein n=1 Tax=Euroglyphus maynei TaxID=6958 RepID=A0A1Y3B668_EURMA|nr:hypothetical protein BLA29_008193 [Euroglyphus maynei]
MASGLIRPHPSFPSTRSSSSANDDKVAHFLFQNNIKCSSTTSSTTTTTTMIRSPNSLANNTPIRTIKSANNNNNNNNNSPSLAIKSPYLHQQQVLPPSSLSLSSSHWPTSKSPGVTPVSTNTPNKSNTMNQLSPTNTSNHNHQHHHPTYTINTPDSPVNFRRQYSLNVNQRGGHQNHYHHHNNNNSSSGANTSRLQLDLRSQKNSPVYQQQSASTDLIDKHSLSPRPRPKDCKNFFSIFS